MNFETYNKQFCTVEVEINAKGNTGHALQFIPITAAEKSRKIINTLLDFREKEESRMNGDLGNVTSINLTMIQVCSIFSCFYYISLHSFC